MVRRSLALLVVLGGVAAMTAFLTQLPDLGYPSARADRNRNRTAGRIGSANTPIN